MFHISLGEEGKKKKVKNKEEAPQVTGPMFE